MPTFRERRDFRLDMAKTPATRANPRSVTIRDVARRAGVSTATVSRALADPERVAEATRTAVFAAIQEVGFIPNASARSLRARTTKMALALINGIGDSFYTSILNAIESTLFESGYGLVMGDTRGAPSREKHYDHLVRSGQVDGVLLFSGRLPQRGFDDLNRSIPILLICNDIPELQSLSVIEVANRDAAFEMIQYLVNLGHNHVAHITGPLTNIEAQERLRGVREAATAFNLGPDRITIWEGAFSVEAGAATARRFLAMKNRPTAVFCASDQVAIGFIKTIRDAGVSVPEDVSVAGFDDIEYASLLSPALTTMHQPRAELGRLAAQQLIMRMRGDRKGVVERTRLPCSLVIRDSVRALRAPSQKEYPARMTASAPGAA
jgi:LacI family repressor for deo operon, udp, cdd, tsx, nupC, and nupG